MIVLGSTLVVMMLDAFAGDIKHLSDAEVLKFSITTAYSQSKTLGQKTLENFRDLLSHGLIDNAIISMYHVRLPVNLSCKTKLKNICKQQSIGLLVSESLEISRHAVATFSEHLEIYCESSIQHNLVSLDVSGIMRSEPP